MAPAITAAAVIGEDHAMPGRQSNGGVNAEDVERVARYLVAAFGESEALLRARQLERESALAPFATAVRKEVERICLGPEENPKQEE